MLLIGRISGAGDISAAEHTTAIRVCHAVLRGINHLCDRMGDEHYLFDAAGETQGGHRYDDQDYNSFEIQEDYSWVERGLWILIHVLDTVDYQLLGRCQLESFHASIQVRR